MSDEEAFVRAFIVPEKQERYLSLLLSPKRRRDILARLDHQLDYDCARPKLPRLKRCLKPKILRKCCTKAWGIWIHHKQERPFENRNHSSGGIAARIQQQTTRM